MKSMKISKYRVIRLLAVFGVVSVAYLLMSQHSTRSANAAMPPPCADVKIVFVRGSGASLNGDVYKKFGSLGPILKDNSSLKSSFYELGSYAYGGSRYPAEGNWRVLVGAKAGGLFALNYNMSVTKGKLELKPYIAQNINDCHDTK